MDVLETGPTPAEQFGTVARNWVDYDYFFIHIKKTDSSGEDGDMPAKVDAIEQVDAALPVLLDLKPDVLAVIGDHCTPAPMKGHSWHPVPSSSRPLLRYRPRPNATPNPKPCAAASASIPADRLLGLMLANAGRLAKFGA
jgi:2,3-bisphosphoglycerate-independent phosphoglycerate mutase